jgi:hypothetical protein
VPRERFLGDGTRSLRGERRPGNLDRRAAGRECCCTSPMANGKENRESSAITPAGLSSRRTVAFRIIWRNVSELFAVVSALRRNASQTEAATNMAAIHKQNQIFTPIVGATLGSREGTLVLPGRSSGLSGTPNSSQTLRHIAIKASKPSVKSSIRSRSRSLIVTQPISRS